MTTQNSTNGWQLLQCGTQRVQVTINGPGELRLPLEDFTPDRLKPLDDDLWETDDELEMAGCHAHHTAGVFCDRTITYGWAYGVEDALWLRLVSMYDLCDQTKRHELTFRSLQATGLLVTWELPDAFAEELHRFFQAQHQTTLT